MQSDITDGMTDLTKAAYELGEIRAIKSERKRISSHLTDHIKHCNYYAVTEQQCDVCAWAEETVTFIWGDGK